MKKYLFSLLAVITIMAASCAKEKESERFRLLTAHVWTSESLLVNGADASGPGGLLENFKGDVTFNKDYTGTFGSYTGSWMLTDDDTTLTISSPDLPMLSLTTVIEELTSTSLKVSFEFTGLSVRMTFKPR